MPSEGISPEDSGSTRGTLISLVSNYFGHYRACFPCCLLEGIECWMRQSESGWSFLVHSFQPLRYVVPLIHLSFCCRSPQRPGIHSRVIQYSCLFIASTWFTESITAPKVSRDQQTHIALRSPSSEKLTRGFQTSSTNHTRPTKHSSANLLPKRRFGNRAWPSLEARIPS